MNTSIRPILLVEDNPMDLDLTLQALQEHGVANTIVSCRDGEEALRYMDAHRSPADGHLPIARAPRPPPAEGGWHRGAAAGARRTRCGSRCRSS